MKKTLPVLLCLSVFLTYAQMPNMASGDIDILTSEFGLVPDLNGTSIETIGVQGNLMKPIKKGMFGVSIGYKQYKLSYDEMPAVVSLHTYDKFQQIRTNLIYRRELKNNWGLMLSAGVNLTSNFEDGISTEDLVYTGIAAFTKRWGDWNRNTTLMFGALYGTQFGEPMVLPMISFSQRLNDQFSYSIGLPLTGLFYTIDKMHSISAYARPEGFFGNNSATVFVSDPGRFVTNSKLQYNIVKTGISYRYRFTKYLSATLDGGFIPLSTLKIVDEDVNDIYDFDPGSGAYFSVGIRLGMQRPATTPKTQESKN
ncbi:MAG: hypothetical protein Aureis2KO_17200 [Aureisphaera sp.]